MKRVIIVILLFTKLYSIEINQYSSNIELLPLSSIYIDKSSLLTKNSIKNSSFREMKDKIISLGFQPNSTLWLRFRLTNSSNSSITKIIEYANPLTEKIIFYDKNSSIINGAWYKNSYTINPYFIVTLDANETREFLIEASSKFSTIIAQLILWNKEEFHKKDFFKKIAIAIFFTIMITLLIYNSFIYFFTKEKAYYYYVLYLIFIVIDEATYSGTAQLFLPHEVTIFITKYIMCFVGLLIYSIIQFTRTFLHTYNFKRIDFLLKISIYWTFIISILSCNNFVLNANSIIVLLPIAFIVAFSGYYALYKGIKEAKYYVVGWSIVLFALILTNLQTLGIIKINESIKYLNDVAFSLEALLFSIALAHRIKITNERLMLLQKEEQKRLQKLVDNKTKELRSALRKEKILYKELNHRVKNNFSMIISLIKLQALYSNKELQIQLHTFENRINSIAKLYEMLNIKEKINTKEYFEKIINNIQNIYDKKVKVSYNINYNLELNKLIYCGLILNELVTNIFKYAFEKEGDIIIKLYKKDGFIFFKISDNGKGYSSNSKPSLGSLIVDTLVKEQLQGELKIVSKNGLKITIKWKI